jgi:hypothetical protein
MNQFIPSQLDDKVFFYSRKLVNDNDIWHIHVDPASCLVSMGNSEDGLPTVADLRQGVLQKKSERDSVVYEGRILLSSGVILTINNKILMLMRDDEAPVDPLKWTSPAGRCDREPVLTALKEYYEEVILFDHVSGEPVFVTFPDNDYAEAVKEIYRTTLIRKGFKHPTTEWISFTADFGSRNRLHLQTVRTCFGSDEMTDDDDRREVFIDNYFPFFDEENNTLELRLLASLSIPDETEARLAYCDGEYERPVKLFSEKEFMQMTHLSMVSTMSYFRKETLQSGSSSS